MKKFLLKVALFFFPFFVYFVLIPIMEVAIRSSRISLELPKDKTILFTGDSHIEQGVNEKFIPHAFNWAKSGDNSLNMFVRTRKLLEANPQIRTVFITATPRDLGKHADWRIFSGDAEVLLQLNIIFYETEDLEDSIRTIACTLKDLRTPIRALKSIYSKNFGELEELGGFLDTGDSTELFYRDLENNGELGKKRLSSHDNDKCGNKLTLKYLRKIVEFVRARGGRIIFLNPPLYHADEFFDVPYFENLLKENFPDVEFWDYADFPMPENCFWDVNHLNSKGAESFSKELARRIREEELTSPSST